MPANRASTLPGYDYGPPVDAYGEGFVPQDNRDAVVIENDGESPLTPSGEAASTTETGGSPTDEANAPVTVKSKVEGLQVVVWWSGPGADGGSEVFWGDGEGPEYPGPGGTSENPALTHTYAAAGDYTITVDPLGEWYPLVSHPVTVTEPTKRGSS